MQRKKIAIITGASAGLGTEFARQIEEKYLLDEIWLVARRAEQMKEVAREFHKAKGMVLALDITSPSDKKELEARLKTENPDLRILVNNAGAGKIGPFTQMGREEQIGMIQLNVTSLTELTHICLPFMSSGASIVQVASSIAYSPAPYFAVYAATKAYVLSLSKALNFELRPRGIHVIAVCPGPVATEFLQVANNNEFTRDKVIQHEPFNKALVARSADVVQKALRDLEKKRSVSVYGTAIKLFTRLMPLMPDNFVMRMMAKRQSAQLGQ